MQGTLEQAVRAVTQEGVTVVGAGRTDAGAHALGQTVAFSTQSTLPVAVLSRALNAHLPMDIAVTSAVEVGPDFHPRYDADCRVYRYLMWNRAVRSPFWLGRAAHVKAHLDEEAMHRAAAHVVGYHDFSAFVPVTAAGNPERTIYRATCRREGDLVVVELEASGFMRQMVRSIVGTLVRVGRGRLSPADFRDILESRDHRRAGDTLSGAGLYLVDIKYARGEKKVAGGGEPSGLARPLSQAAPRREELG